MVGSATSSIPDHVSRAECIRSCAAAGPISVGGVLQRLHSRNTAHAKRTVLSLYREHSACQAYGTQLVQGTLGHARDDGKSQGWHG